MATQTIRSSIIPQIVSLMVLLPSVFGGRHEDFLSNGWSFIGNVDRSCSSELNEELYCKTGVIPPCDSSTDGKTVQDRTDHNECVAQGCETGNQMTKYTYYCGASRHEDFLSKGWSFIGNVDRQCSSELDEDLYCDGVTVPNCDSLTNGKTVQDRKTHNNCVAQGCETGNQYVQLTYYCQVEDRCDRLDIDGYLTGCSTTIVTMSGTISSNKAEFDTFKVEANKDILSNKAEFDTFKVKTNKDILSNKAEFDSFKVDVNIALDEIADFNAAHAPILNIDDDLNTNAFISLKDSVIFGLLFLNLVVVIYVFCALKAQNKKLKAGYSRTYNKDIIENDIIENGSDAQPLKV